ncbi:MAG: hypothetical protein M3Q17_10665 [Actinomycetota bacterium]|nr:hypothetical protein [Actinomycetota bacterium]
MEELPRSARLVCWFNAWVAGDAAPDDLTDAVTGDDAAHSVTGIDDEVALPLLLGLAALRRAGAHAATLALPAPGDPVGVGGPRNFNEAAVEAGEAAVFTGAGLGLVPSVVGSGVFWAAHPAVPATTVPDVASGERALREALVAAAEQATGADSAPFKTSGSAPSREQVTDVLAALRTSRPVSLPTSYSTRAGRLAASAMRCLTILDLTPERQPVLVELERAARHALVAAGSETPQQRASAGR